MPQFEYNNLLLDFLPILFLVLLLLLILTFSQYKPIFKYKNNISSKIQAIRLYIKNFSIQLPFLFFLGVSNQTNTFYNRDHTCWVGFSRSSTVFLDNSIHMLIIITTFCILIACIIFVWIVDIIYLNKFNFFPKKLSESSAVENVFLIFPIIIVLILIVCSLASIYAMDSIVVTSNTNLDIIGSQWKWHYTVSTLF